MIKDIYKGYLNPLIKILLYIYIAIYDIINIKKGKRICKIYETYKGFNFEFYITKQFEVFTIPLEGFYKMFKVLIKSPFNFI